MTHIETIAETYISCWNERDETTRQTRLSQAWTSDASYIDPLMSGTGLAAISGLIGATHAQFPDFNFKLIGQPSEHGPYGRFSWSLGPSDGPAPIEGTDFVEIIDGKLSKVVGFLDKLPA